MKYEDRIVCFIDMLGFEKHISDSIQGSQATEKVKELYEVLGDIRTIFNIDCHSEPQDKVVTQFSDSVVISFPAYSESGVFDALQEIMRVQVRLARKGYLCRGGIVRGLLIHTPALLFGPAMIEAYKLESKAALYPRVVLDTDIINAGTAAHDSHHEPRHVQQSMLNLLRRDLDGMYYIDYITRARSGREGQQLDYPDYLIRLRDIISSGLLAQNPSIYVKYKWMREKLAPHLLQVKEEARQRPIGDKTRETYESIPDI